MSVFRARRFAAGLPCRASPRLAARGDLGPSGGYPSRGTGRKVRSPTGRGPPDGNAAGSAQSQTQATATNLIAVSTNPGPEDVIVWSHARRREAISPVAVAAM